MVFAAVLLLFRDRLCLPYARVPRVAVRNVGASCLSEQFGPLSLLKTGRKCQVSDPVASMSGCAHDGTTSEIDQECQPSHRQRGREQSCRPVLTAVVWTLFLGWCLHRRASSMCFLSPLPSQTGLKVEGHDRSHRGVAIATPTVTSAVPRGNQPRPSRRARSVGPNFDQTGTSARAPDTNRREMNRA
jgi:hypothetical protein